MALLTQVGLAAKALNYPEELSGGQKQRVSIARALAMHPEILLLDEPTSALDPAMVQEVSQILQQLAQQGTTMLIVTHDMQLAQRLSTQVLYLDEGIVYEAGTPEALFHNPQKPKTQAFLNEKKQFCMEIAIHDFALSQIMEQVAAFAHANSLTSDVFYHLQLCLEELLIHGFAASKIACTSVKIGIKILAKNELILTLDYPSTNNVLYQLDELSAKVLQCTFAEYSFKCGTTGSQLLFHLR